MSRFAQRCRVLMTINGVGLRFGAQGIAELLAARLDVAISAG